MRALAIVGLALCLSGCFVSFHPIGDFGLGSHHHYGGHHHEAPACVYPHCIDDSGMIPSACWNGKPC